MMKKALKIFVCMLIVASTALSILPLSIGANDDTNSVLYQKSAIFVGDSISSGEGCEDPVRAWAGRIGEANDMEYHNASKPSISISTSRKIQYGTVLGQLELCKDKSADYVIMQGGVNDASDRAPVGTVSSSKDPSTFYTFTFAGGLEELFYYAKTWFPDATYGFIINYAVPSFSKAADMSEYVAVAKQVCEKWEIPYLDLYNDTDFCQNVLKVTEKTYLFDNLHPNAAGYDLLAPKIEAWMIEITPSPVVTEDTTPDTTTTPETTTPAEEKGGCRSAIAYSTIFSVCVITLTGAALLLRRRKFFHEC